MLHCYYVMITGGISANFQSRMKNPEKEVMEFIIILIMLAVREIINGLTQIQLQEIWEQMNLAWEFNARQIWIVNVGDIKPMEFPISFFLDYAWNPEKIGAARPSKIHRAMGRITVW